MIPIFDKTYSWCKNSKFSSRREELPPKIVQVNDSSNNLTVSFVPTSVISNGWALRRILPYTGTVYVHPVSALYHMTPDIDETVMRLERTYQEAVRDLIDGTNSQT